MNKKQKHNLLRILSGALIFLFAHLLPAETTSMKVITLGLYLAAYLILGGDVLVDAVRHILQGQVMDENFLMALATVGAVGLQDYSEAVAVMLFYQVGEFFEDYAVGRSRESIAAIMEIRPDTANLIQGDDITIVDPEEVAVGDFILVKPGERVPLDGVIVEGQSSLDTSALTGESAPRAVESGDDIYSGSVNLSGTLKIHVSKPFAESTVCRILELVENASDKKSKSENFITRFAAVYTPAVVITALVLAVLPPLLLGGGWKDWLNRALIFLVVSCPCALVISVPLSFFGGIGGASRKGILVKGSNYLEALASVKTILFDKTGTLTKGSFTVSAVHPEASFQTEDLLHYAAGAEAFSTHPIADSIRKAYGKPVDIALVSENQELAGHGVTSVVDGKTVLLGNEKLMRERNIPTAPCDLPGTIIHIALDQCYAGHIVITDTIKEDAADAIRDMKTLGIQKTVMLTGDKEEVAADVARQLKIDEYHAELLPEDKVKITESVIEENTGIGKTAFTGDGINDAPVLMRADVGIAMGAMGSDAAIEAADIVLMNDSPSDIVTAIRIAQKTLRIVRQNIVFALTVKLLVLILAAFGQANMGIAVFADVGVAFIAILNAMRCLK